MKKYLLILLLIGVLVLSSCSTDKGFVVAGPLEKNPEVTIEMENGEKIVIELYYDKAPNTVMNFISLVSDGFYDGLTFHRVIKGFVIQGGDPDGNGTGGPGYGIVGEFSENGYKNNDIKHELGVISMARSNAFDSAGSQFFICDGLCENLDGKYAAFGKVVQGIEEVRRIAGVKTDSYDMPVKPEVMRTVTVETFDVKFDPPKIIEEE